MCFVIEDIRRRLEVYTHETREADGRPRAAVLLPLYTLQGGLHVVLTKRTMDVATHKGEISFPGGAMDTTDDDLVYTALRESDEEIGLKKEHVRVLGRLDDIFSRGGFHVAAFVGEIDPDCSPYPWRPQASEVAEVLEIPLPHFLDAANYVEVPTTRRDGELIVMEGCRYGEHVVWGMTWRLLRHFLDIAVVTEDTETAATTRL
jgi:8-oxo-dGTP pyrophosphatase MutT (NUDIX family)